MIFEFVKNQIGRNQIYQSIDLFWNSEIFKYQQMSREKLKGMLQKQYQQRNQFEHGQIVEFLQPFFRNLSANTIKLITFYIQVIQKDDSEEEADRRLQHGILIMVASNEERDQRQKNPETMSQYMVIKNKKVNISQDYSFGLYITYDNYLSCVALGQSSIEEEMGFFQMSEYLCSMPRKKCFIILRNSKVLAFTHRQVIYFEGQMIIPGENGSGVYLVRQGQLAYVKKIKEKHVQMYRFGPGHLLGNLQLQAKQPNRLFSVKCKSGRVVVYNMTQQFFDYLIRPYCQQVFKRKQSKLERFLTQNSQKIQKFRQQHKEFNVTLRKSLTNVTDANNQLKTQRNLNMFTSRDLPILINTSRYSNEIDAQELSRASSLALKKEGPLKNYPKPLQRSKFLESHFGQMDKLKEKNQKISKIRTIKNIQSIETKESILFTLFQNSWKFQKQKKVRNV